MRSVGKLESLIYQKFERGQRQLAVLIDPDKLPQDAFLIEAETLGVDYFFVGGSLLTGGSLSECIARIRKHTAVPVILFPGSAVQVDNSADGILFLSLLSGRNPEFLIGQQVLAAPYLKQSKLEVLSTGYLLIDGGKPTTASYISNTQPIPAEKPEIALSTALAGELLGMKLIYLDGGSGAFQPVPTPMIEMVRKHLSVPLIVGGGIKNTNALEAAFDAGASVVVVGNLFENKPELLADFMKVVRKTEYTSTC